MATIDPLQSMVRLAALLRHTAQQQSTAQSHVKNASSKVESRHADIGAAISLRQQLLAIPPEHPQRRRALARVWVESLLVQTFGSTMGNEPAFQSIVDDVVDALQRHPSISAEMDAVTTHLLNSIG